MQVLGVSLISSVSLGLSLGLSALSILDFSHVVTLPWPCLLLRPHKHVLPLTSWCILHFLVQIPLLLCCDAFPFDWLFLQHPKVLHDALPPRGSPS